MQTDRRDGGSVRRGATADIAEGAQRGGGSRSSTELDGCERNQRHSNNSSNNRGAEYWAKEEQAWQRHAEETAMNLAIGRGRRGGLGGGGSGVYETAALAARTEYERWGLAR
eukprot:COSAG05_NODE_1775_length_4109_cov_2.715960_3_plen_112_part_00